MDAFEAFARPPFTCLKFVVYYQYMYKHNSFQCMGILRLVESLEAIKTQAQWQRLQDIQLYCTRKSTWEAYSRFAFGLFSLARFGIFIFYSPNFWCDCLSPCGPAPRVKNSSDLFVTPQPTV